jgi:protein TonB
MTQRLMLGIVFFILIGSVFAQAPAQAPKRVRAGGKMMQARLTYQVPPTYPQEARRTGIQGTVRLEVVIGQDGSVLNMMPISGNKALAKAAMEAVSKWRYKPCFLNGTPVEVLTEVDVNFRLAAK